MSEIKSMYGFNLGDRVTLVKISKEIVDRNPRIKIGDTGKIVMFHSDEYYEGHPQVTVAWDRKGTGDTRRVGDTYIENCWAISIHGIDNSDCTDYDPILWKVRDMWNRQPYVKNQIGAIK